MGALAAVAAALGCGAGAPNHPQGSAGDADGLAPHGDEFSGDDHLAGESAGDGAAGDESHPPGLDPVLFVHGVNGDAGNFATMVSRLIDDGWPSELLFAYTFEYPISDEATCNADSATVIAGWVDAILVATGKTNIDIVAHSMGTLSSRYYIKNLGGQDVVNTYATLGGQHHGLSSPCASNALGEFQPCAWKELCESNEFIAQLNADPATPGDLWWVSVHGTADDSTPIDSAILDGAENIAMEGVEHAGANGLLEVVAVYEEIRRVLQYPSLR